MKKEYLKAVGRILCVAFIIWVVFSFLEVNAHNLNDCVYSDWNFFKLLFFKNI